MKVNSWFKIWKKFNDSDKRLADQIYSIENFSTSLETYCQIGKDLVEINAITSPNRQHEIFPAFRGTISRQNELLRKQYNEYTDRKSESSQGDYYDLISEQIECDKTATKYLQVKLIPQCLAEISDKVFIAIHKANKNDSYLERLSKFTKYSESSGIKATLKYIKSLGVDIESIYHNTVLKYFGKFGWQPAINTRILNVIIKDSINRYLIYDKNNSILIISDSGKYSFCNELQSKFRSIGYTFAASEAKPMLAHCKNWEVVIWIKHPLCKLKNSNNRPILYLPANRHTHYLDKHGYMTSPEAKLETISKCYLKVYTNSTLPCLLYNKAHTNLRTIPIGNRKLIQYKNKSSVAAVFPEINIDKREVKLCIAYTNDISKQQISYLNTTIPLKKVTSLWNKLTNIKKGKKTHKAGGSAYIHSGEEYSNIRSAIQDAFVRTLRLVLPRNIGRVLIVKADKNSFSTTNSSFKPEALYNLGFSFKGKKSNNVYNYGPFITIHDELTKAIARTCRDRGILMSAVPIFDVQRVCHVCGTPVPVTGRAICPSCSVGGIMEAQSSTQLKNSGIHHLMVDEYQFGSFTASNLLFSIVDRRYQTLVLPGDEWITNLQKSDLVEFEHFAKSVIRMTKSKSLKSYITEVHKDGVDLHFSKFAPDPNTQYGEYPVKWDEYHSITEIVNGLYTSLHVMDENTKFPFMKLVKESTTKETPFEIPNAMKVWSDAGTVWNALNGVKKEVKDPELIDSYWKIAQEQYQNIKVNCTRNFKEYFNDPDISGGTYSDLLDSRSTHGNGKDSSKITRNQTNENIGENYKVNFDKSFGTISLAEYGFGMSKKIQSFALSLNMNLNISGIPLWSIDYDKFLRDLHTLLKVAKEAAIAYSIYCTKNNEKIIAHEYWSVTDKKITDIVKEDGGVLTREDYLSRYIATIDNFVLTLYCFNELYKELLEGAFIGPLDYDDCIQYYTKSTSRIKEMLNCFSTEQLMHLRTKFKYRSKYYTDIKSLAKFYQYLYGIIHTIQFKYDGCLKADTIWEEQDRADYSRWYKKFKKAIKLNYKKFTIPQPKLSEVSTAKTHYYNEKYSLCKGNYSGLYTDNLRGYYKFNWFSILGSNPYENEFIEPTTPENIKAVTTRGVWSKLTDNTIPSYLGGISRAFKAGTSIIYKHDPRRYSVQRYMSQKLKIERGISCLNLYEYDYCPEQVISAGYLRTQVHPIHKIESAIVYDSINYRYNCSHQYFGPNRPKLIQDKSYESIIKTIFDKQSIAVLKAERDKLLRDLSFTQFSTIYSCIPIHNMKYYSDEEYWNILPYRKSSYSVATGAYASRDFDVTNRVLEKNKQNIIDDYEWNVKHGKDTKYITDWKYSNKVKQKQELDVDKDTNTDIILFDTSYVQHLKHPQQIEHLSYDYNMLAPAMCYGINGLNSRYTYVNQELELREMNFVESKWFNYTNDFKDLDLVVPEIQGSEHRYRCIQVGQMVSNSRVSFNINPNGKPVSYDENSLKLIKWLRNPHNAERILRYREHFKNAINSLCFRPKSRTYGKLRNSNWKYYWPTKILNELGLGKVLDVVSVGGNTWDISQALRTLLIYLAHVPLRYFTEHANTSVTETLIRPNGNLRPLKNKEEVSYTLKANTDRLNKLLPKNYRTQNVTWKSKQEQVKCRKIIHSYLMWSDLKKEAIEYFESTPVLELRAWKAEQLIKIAQDRFEEIDKYNAIIQKFKDDHHLDQLAYLAWKFRDHYRYTIPPKVRRILEENPELTNLADELKSKIDIIECKYDGNTLMWYKDDILKLHDDMQLKKWKWTKGGELVYLW